MQKVKVKGQLMKEDRDFVFGSVPNKTSSFTNSISAAGRHFRPTYDKNFRNSISEADYPQYFDRVVESQFKINKTPF